MDILNKSITSFDFGDIVKFCKINEREDIQLDYKKDLTTGSLSKHFAAFSNTRGGVIIIGVEEDKTTGFPKASDGVLVNAQDIETIHQWANNVSPLPKYKIHPTNENKGMRFILIRIYEGDDTPYYVQNDGRVWIRTGNISKELIEIASSDYSRLLYGKRIESEKARNYYLSRADDVLSAYLANATQDKIIKTHANIASNAIYPKYFENAKSLLTLILQPAYPFEPLTSPFELKDKIRDYQSNGHLLSEYPSSNVDAIPEGVADFNYHLDEITYQCNQIYSQGLLYYKLSIEDRKSNKNGVVNLQYLVGKILVFFKSAQKFYTLFGYQGTLKGNINLDNVRGVYVQPYSNGFPSDGCNLLLNNYVWNINLDTRILLDEGGLMQYYLNICNKIYWDLGFSYHYSEGNIKDYLRSIRLLPPV